MKQFTPLLQRTISRRFCFTRPTFLQKISQRALEEEFLLPTRIQICKPVALLPIAYYMDGVMDTRVA
jgi:hypothetical protein